MALPSPPSSLSALWLQFREGRVVPCHREPAGRIALLVLSPDEQGLESLYRLVCTHCSWGSPWFTVSGDVASLIPREDMPAGVRGVSAEHLVGDRWVLGVRLP